MRGKLIQSIVDALPQRITPADAGKTGFAELTGDDAENHPRGCGENPIPMQPPSGRQGSPPRMRGKPKHRPEVDPCLRITPADAGKTRNFLPKFLVHQDHPRGCGENLYLAC